MSEYFPDVPKIQYEGSDSKNPLAFKHYNPDEVVEGKPMRDHFRFAAAYWHCMRNPLLLSRPRRCAGARNAVRIKLSIRCSRRRTRRFAAADRQATALGNSLPLCSQTLCNGSCDFPIPRGIRLCRSPSQKSHRGNTSLGR